jgi:hypothetical protein
MKMYGLPAGLLRTAFALFGVGAILTWDDLGVSLPLFFVGAVGLLGLELYLRYHATDRERWRHSRSD